MFVLVALFWVSDPAMAMAQDLSNDPFFIGADEHALRRGPGGYFAWYKLVAITLAFAVWVALADYANREALRLAEFLNTKAEVWNPIFVVTFLAGFVAVMSIPWFWAGYPVYLLASFLPLVIFFMTRNREVDRSMRKAISVTGRVEAPIEILKKDQVDLNPLEVAPSAQPGQSEQQTLFSARQTPGFAPMKDLLTHGLASRADLVVLSCTRDKAVAQMQVDGMWHPLMEFEPGMGQAIAATSQIVAGCTPKVFDRPQEGIFRLKREREKWGIRFTSQPTKSDFRCLFRFETGEETVMSLAELGMSEQQAAAVRDGIAGDGFYVASAMSGQGMTTLWKSCLQATDRWTRDWFAVVPETDDETMMENIARDTFPKGDAKAAIALIHKMALKQAGAFVVPDLVDKTVVDTLLTQSKEEGRKTLTRFTTKSAAEALLRTYAAAGDRKAMAKALKGAVYQKLVRKLCTNCRETTKVAPELIKKLGGDPMVQDFVYKTRTIPAEKPKDYQPCPVCNDIGFAGRTGLFEILQVDDSIRKILLTQPKVEAITAAARKSGMKTLMQSGFPLVMAGTTTIEELKRVCGN